MHEPLLKEFTHLESLVFRSKWVDKVEENELSPFSIKNEGIIPYFDLEPLENLVKLRSLDIQANSIKDLSALKKLVKLTHLSIAADNITDLSPLKKLVNLSSFFISSKDVKDLNPLADLKHLRKLSIQEHQVMDLNSLRNLKNLKSLTIGGINNYFASMHLMYFMEHQVIFMGGPKKTLNGLSDLRGLESLTELEFLHLMDTEVSDLRPIQNLIHLKKLYLYNNKVIDLSPLRYMVHLQSLNLVRNQIANIEPLKGLIYLSSVELGHNPIQNINSLAHLTKLYSIACPNTLIEDLSPLKNLVNLQSLNIQNTPVNDLSPLKNLINLQSLNFKCSKVSNIESLKNLINLRSLVAGTTMLKDLSALKYLVNLSQLDINPVKDSQIFDRNSNNYLAKFDVPSDPIIDLAPLQNLENLSWLVISNTNISDLTPLKDLAKLKGVTIENSQVRDLTPLRNLVKKGGHISGVDNCRISPLLKAAYKKGTDAVLKYLDKRKKDLFEARVLVLGEPRAGKTTLRRKLKNTNAPMPDTTESTKAFEIEVDPYKISVQNKGKTEKLTYHLWDFGGQEYYRLLHQLFVTEQCVYIIVTDTDRNKNEEEIDFWLETIERLSKDAQGQCAPVVLLQNPKTNRDGNDFTSLKKRYPFWQQHEPFVINLNALDNRNIKTFQQTHFERFGHFKTHLEQLFFQLDHVGMEIFAEWYPIRRTLSLKRKDYISIEMFREICTNKGVSDVSEQEYLLYIFHTLGFLQYYQNAPALKDMVILNREWVTDALYRVLDHETVRTNKGWFIHTDVPEIWNDSQYRDKTHALLALMQEFKLSYFNDVSRKFIVPAKLPEDTEGLPEWDLTQNVHLHLQYEWLPLAVTTQLVVLLHEHIVPFKNGEHWIWRKGAVIDGRKLDLVNTQVQIEENTKKSYISVRARGVHSETLIRIVRQKWQEVHAPFEHKVKVSTIILCGCETCLKSPTPQKFKYENVLKAKAIHAPLQCHESFKSFSAEDILKGIFGEFKVLVDSGALKELIKKGRIKDALELLPNDDVAMQLQGSYTRLSEAMMRNTVSFQEKELELAKISDRLLKYLKENQF